MKVVLPRSTNGAKTKPMDPDCGNEAPEAHYSVVQLLRTIFLFSIRFF